MAVSLGALLKVQRIEGRIGLLDQEISKRPQMVGKRSTEVGTLRSKRTGIDELLKNGQILSDKLELDSRTIEEKIKESTERLNNAQNNKEYKGLQDQIANFQTELSEVETNILQVLARVEEITSEGQEIDQQILKKEQEMVRAEEVASVETESMEKERSQLLEELREARTGADSEHLELYDTLRTRYFDQSVVSAEDDICGGCHLSLNPQVISALSRSDGLVTCPNCSRILHA